MPEVGEFIGSYRILKQLGSGAMGEVYLAEHRHLKRKAAVKLLAPELVGRPDLLERFFLEARATSAIAHPATRRRNNAGWSPSRSRGGE